MIKLTFTYQGEPFQQGIVSEMWRHHPAQISTLLTRIARHEVIHGEFVLHYGQDGPREYQIDQLSGVTTQKLGQLFSKVGFRQRVG